MSRCGVLPAREGGTTAQLLRGSAAATAGTGAGLQGSEEPVAEQIRRHGVNPKTVAKWRKRDSVDDSSAGPRERASTTLAPPEGTATVASRAQTRPPPDDVFVAVASVVIGTLVLWRLGAFGT